MYEYHYWVISKHLDLWAMALIIMRPSHFPALRVCVSLWAVLVVVEHTRLAAPSWIWVVVVVPVACPLPSPPPSPPSPPLIGP